MLKWQEEFYYGEAGSEFNEFREAIDAEIARRVHEYFNTLDKDDNVQDEN